MSDKWAQPLDVSDVDVAFGGDMARLLPPIADIPEPFRRGNTPQNNLFSTLFFSGGKLPATKPGIDARKAKLHLSAVMRSFEPKHEHKEAACAYLMSLWYETPEKGKR